VNEAEVSKLKHRRAKSVILQEPLKNKTIENRRKVTGKRNNKLSQRTSIHISADPDIVPAPIHLTVSTKSESALTSMAVKKRKRNAKQSKFKTIKRPKGMGRERAQTTAITEISEAAFPAFSLTTQMSEKEREQVRISALIRSKTQSEHCFQTDPNLTKEPETEKPNQKKLEETTKSTKEPDTKTKVDTPPELPTEKPVPIEPRHAGSIKQGEFWTTRSKHKEKCPSREDYQSPPMQRPRSRTVVTMRPITPSQTFRQRKKRFETPRSIRKDLIVFESNSSSNQEVIASSTDC